MRIKAVIVLFAILVAVCGFSATTRTDKQRLETVPKYDIVERGKAIDLSAPVVKRQSRFYHALASNLYRKTIAFAVKYEQSHIKALKEAARIIEQQRSEQKSNNSVYIPPVVHVTHSGNSVWDALAQCESGGDWGANTGNGFEGGLQFDPGTYAAYGGTGHAYNASREEQITVAQRVLAAQGPEAWPICSYRAGMR